MKTEELIAFLAARTTPVEANAVARRFAPALGWGAFCTTLLMALVLGVRADLMSVIHLPMFWVKLALPL
ncbi:MAG TPA: NrsF family protein, partial [Casimicrobiaceae bacterium]|nr:NrsF family protein [Casimicrobiaceae bacterium]